MTTRRDFLRTAGSAAVLSLSPGLPGVLAAAAAQQPSTKGDTVLVVVQLSGGNDGLNTIVPHGDDAYHKNRFTLRVRKENAIKIDDYAGFHPSMRPFSELLEKKRLAIVQGVGYPHPNRSHFESMDIWHTARQEADRRHTGWLGRYLDALSTKGAAPSDVPALHLGGERAPLALSALTAQAASVRSLDQFRYSDGGDSRFRGTFEKTAGGARSDANDLVRFLQSSTTAALTSSERVHAAIRDYKPAAKYPGTGLAGRLRSVAQLIDAGLATRIYYVALDGFDTHSDQGEAHANLLAELSGAVGAFIDDLAQHGHGNRVLVMMFSEFGRRLRENASRGTDHGAAAPMFLAGGRVRPGLIGRHPSLTDLDDGDPKFHTDFREIYAAVLQTWLGWNTDGILDAKFKPAEILAS
jgi:uncharacterized protein (DUF1501 family)